VFTFTLHKDFNMEQRYLGNSGFKVPALGFGAGTFGGQGPLFSAWGNTYVAGARRIIDICLDSGVSLFDTADVYSNGASESLLGVSNFSGWQLMKSLAAADRLGLQRYVANQSYYSLVGRDYEWELMPLGIDQGVGAIVWSPLGWGRLTGKIRRGQPLPAGSRLHDTAGFAPPVDEERLYRVVDAMDQVAEETGKTLPQIALNWLLQRPTVASVLIGARDEEQLKHNLGAL